MGSLHTLSSLLKKHYGLDVIMLIDEYDVPLAKANENGYYDQMVMLIRNMFDQALKTNDNLKFAVLTGCLRVAKESIFTGLNNMKVLSITDVRFDEYFGFMDSEVRELLEYYDLSDYYDTIKEWYKRLPFSAKQMFTARGMFSAIATHSAVIPAPLRKPTGQIRAEMKPSGIFLNRPVL